jgi:hypothetical protein
MRLTSRIGGKRGRAVQALSCVGVLALLLSGCAKGHTVAPAAQSSGGGLATYSVSVQKFKYSGMPASIKGGLAAFTFTNGEAFPITHEMVVLSLPAGKAAQDVVSLAKSKGPDSEDSWLHFGEVSETDTGATQASLFSLTPGTYALACFQTGTPEGKENGPVHATIGMIFQFSVT